MRAVTCRVRISLPSPTYSITIDSMITVLFTAFYTKQPQTGKVQDFRVGPDDRPSVCQTSASRQSRAILNEMIVTSFASAQSIRIRSPDYVDTP